MLRHMPLARRGGAPTQLYHAAAVVQEGHAILLQRGASPGLLGCILDILRVGNGAPFAISIPDFNSLV